MSWISFFSIIVGTISISCTLAIINGTASLVKQTLTTFDADIKIFNKNKKYFNQSDIDLERVKKIPHVNGVNKILEETAYLEYKDNFAIANILGVEHLSPILQKKTKGDTDLQSPNAILGLGIHAQLFISTRDDEPIKVKIPKRKLKGALLGNKIYNVGSLTPVGVFSVEQRYDNKFVLTHLAHLQKITKNNSISGIELCVDSEQNIPNVKNEISKILPPQFGLETKLDKQQLLTKALNLEKVMTVLSLGVIIFIALLNLLFILSMIVLSKKQDILILKMLGETKIFSWFFYLGTLLGLFGSLIGVGIGEIIFFLQNKFGFIKVGVESILVQAYPMEIKFYENIIIVVCFTLVSALISIYPARRACKFDL